MADPRTLLPVVSYDMATDRIEISIEDRQLGAVQTDALNPHTDEWLGPKIQIGPLDV